MNPLFLFDRVASTTPPPTGSFRWGTRSLSNDWDSVVALKPGMLVRRAFPWNAVETSATSGYSWAGIDSWIAAATAKGIKIMAVASQAPAWATNGRGAGNKYPEGHQSDFYDFCAAAAARYPQVAYWEIMNEPDLNSWTSAQVAEILIGAANAMVGARPSAKCLGICTAGSFSKLRTFVTPILNAIRGVSSIYGVSFHDYTRPYAPELVPSGRGGPLIQQMDNSIAMMDTAGFSGPLFITEFGCPTTYSGTRLDGYVSEADAARWIVRQSIIHGSYSRMERSVQFHLFGSSTAIEEGGMGLIRGANDRGGPGETSAGPAGSKKPGYFSYQNMMDILDENTTSITAQSTGPLYKYRYDKVGGGFGYVVWTTTGTQSASLTGLTDTVTVTQNNGTSATQSTTGGNITITATIDPQYIETIAIPVQPVSWWAAKWGDGSQDLGNYQALSLSTSAPKDGWSLYNLAPGIDGNGMLYRATGDTKFLERALMYIENCIARSVVSNNTNFPSSSYKDGYLGWINITHPTGADNDEQQLHEFYMWRYVMQLLYYARNETAYASRMAAILSFTETNIWTKWYGRGSGQNRLYRETIYMTSHTAIVALYLKGMATSATVRSQCQTVLDNIDHIGFPIYLKDNVKPSFRGQMLVHPVDSDAYIFKAFWPYFGQSEPYYCDQSHGDAFLTYVIAAMDMGYGDWGLTDIQKFLKMAAEYWPSAGVYGYWLLGSTAENNRRNGGNYNDGTLKLGGFNAAFQRRVETHTSTVNGAQFQGCGALNAARLLGTVAR